MPRRAVILGRLAEEESLLAMTAWLVINIAVAGWIVGKRITPQWLTGSAVGRARGGRDDVRTR